MAKPQKKSPSKSLAPQQAQKRPSEERQAPAKKKTAQDGGGQKKLPPVPLSKASYCKLREDETKSTEGQILELQENLKEYESREDDRDKLKEQLDKAEVRLTISQRELKDLEDKRVKTERRLKLLEKKEEGSPQFDKFVLNLHGTLHDERVKVEMDLTRLVEENERLKAELGTRPSAHILPPPRKRRNTKKVASMGKENLGRFSYVQQLRRVVVEEWKIEAEGYLIYWKFEVAVTSTLLRSVGRQPLQDNTSMNGAVPRQPSFQELDAATLVWPYGQDQADWVSKAQRKFTTESRPALKVLKNVYEKWVEGLNESQRKARIVGLRNPAHPSGNQLTSLDCAFLGRLLVALKDELRLKYQLELLEPPHKLPYDFRCVKRLDVVPVA